MAATAFLISLAAFVGGIVQASTGFGMAIVLMALWPLVMPVADAVILTPFVSAIAVFSIAIRQRRHLNFSLVALPGAISALIMLLSFNLMLHSDSAFILRILGGVLILLSAYFFFFAERISLPAGPLAASLAGLLSGVLGGMFSISGPPMALYYSVAIRDKDEYLATLQTFFAINLLVKILYSLFFVDLPLAVLPAIPFAIGACFLGMLVGNLIFRKLNSSLIKKAVYAAMMLSGLWFVLDKA